MAYWKSRGLRGAGLEEIINMTNERYRTMGIALIQKIPTPIKPIEIDQKTRHITLAYFEKKSTIDYIGMAQGIPICFDAKETVNDYLPMQNIHKHQLEFMSDFEKQGGISFFLVYSSILNKYYYVTLKLVLEYAEEEKKKILLTDVEDKYVIKEKGLYINYLDIVNVDLDNRNN